MRGLRAQASLKTDRTSDTERQGGNPGKNVYILAIHENLLHRKSVPVLPAAQEIYQKNVEGFTETSTPGNDRTQST